MELSSTIKKKSQRMWCGGVALRVSSYCSSFVVVLSACDSFRASLRGFGLRSLVELYNLGCVNLPHAPGKYVSLPGHKELNTKIPSYHIDVHIRFQFISFTFIQHLSRKVIWAVKTHLVLTHEWTPQMSRGLRRGQLTGSLCVNQGRLLLWETFNYLWPHIL